MRNSLALDAVVVAAGIAIAYCVRRTERDSRDRLHLQAWHLRALVPHSSHGRDTSPAA